MSPHITIDHWIELGKRKQFLSVPAYLRKFDVVTQNIELELNRIEEFKLKLEQGIDVFSFEVNTVIQLVTDLGFVHAKLWVSALTSSLKGEPSANRVWAEFSYLSVRCAIHRHGFNFLSAKSIR